jgi:hypothetical protein
MIGSIVAGTMDSSRGGVECWLIVLARFDLRLILMGPRLRGVTKLVIDQVVRR